MKRNFFWENLSTFLCIFIFSVLGLAQSETKKIEQGQIPLRLNSPNDVSQIAEWKRFNFAEENFSILFPNKPGLHNNSNPLPQGVINQFRYYWDTSDEQLYFEAQVLEVSAEMSFNLKVNAEGFKQKMKNRNAVLLNEKDKIVNDVSVVDLSFQVPDEPEPILNFSRILFCNNRIYTLMVAGTKLQKKLSDNATKYFDSFTPIVGCEKQKDKTAITAKRYIRGPKGGCYYYSSQRTKVYVDRSLCR